MTALVVYDWCLCLSLEVRFIWEWRSRVTLSSLLYAFSRYGMVIQAILAIASNLPMSDLVRTPTPQKGLFLINVCIEVNRGRKLGRYKLILVSPRQKL